MYNGIFCQNLGAMVDQAPVSLYPPGLPLPSAKCAKCAKKFHLARLLFIWRKRLAHTFFADIFIFFFVISGMSCASG